MNKEQVGFADVYLALSRNRGLFFKTLIAVMVAVVVVSAVLPKKYKSKGVINIDTRYFQNPLIGDLVSNPNESRDPRNERESLIRSAISSEFIDHLGETYRIYKSTADSSLRAKERSDLMKKIEIYSVGPTMFQLSVMGGDPDVAQKMTTEILKHVVENLTQERKKRIGALRDEVQAQLSTLSNLQPQSGFTGSVHLDEAQAAEELGRVEEEISSVKQYYTEKNPELQRLRERAAYLKSRAHSQVGQMAGKAPIKLVSNERPNPAVATDVYRELLKKQRYLTIAYNVEEAQGHGIEVVESASQPLEPVWPNPSLFVAWGSLLALGLAGGVVSLKEYVRNERDCAHQLSKALNIPVLGIVRGMPQRGSE